MKRWLFLCAAALASPMALPTPLGAHENLPPHEIKPVDLIDLPVADVVVLGEVHDNPSHHANQAAAILALQPRAIVWEMIPEGMDPPDPGQSLEALSKALQWQERGWPDFQMYYALFQAAPLARHYGAGVSRELARRAISEGPMAVIPDGARFGLDQPLPEDQQAQREAEQQEAHCNALSPDLLPGMVAAQRLRDAALARAALRALEELGPPVVVITGSGHARKDWGMPATLAHAAPDVTLLSIGQFEADPGPNPPFDLWLIEAAPPRPDPCLAFR